MNISDNGKKYIQRLAAFNLAYIAIFVQTGFWSGFSGIDNYAASVLSHLAFGLFDPFYWLTSCLFLGFSILWIIALIQGVVQKDALTILLVLLAIAGGLTLLITGPNGTLKGWFFIGYVNTVVFVANAVMAFIYSLVGRVKK